MPRLSVALAVPCELRPVVFCELVIVSGEGGGRIRARGLALAAAAIVPIACGFPMPNPYDAGGGSAGPVPEQLGTSGPGSFTIDSNHLYLTSNEFETQTLNIFECPLSGCDPTTAPIATQPGSSTGAGASETTIAVDADSIYWVTAAGAVVSLSRCSIDGCTPTTLFSDATGTRPVRNIALDADNVYWASVVSSTQATIEACSKTSGCGSGTPIMVGSAGELAGALLTSQESLYWVHGDETIRTCSLPSCESDTTIFAMQNTLNSQIGNFAVDTENIYWTATQGVFSCPLEGCTVPTAVSTAVIQNFYDIAVDEQNVFWANERGGPYYCSKTSCNNPAPIPISYTGCSQQIAVDDSYIYWSCDITMATGIWRISKAAVSL